MQLRHNWARKKLKMSSKPHKMCHVKCRKIWTRKCWGKSKAIPSQSPCMIGISPRLKSSRFLSSTASLYRSLTDWYQFRISRFLFFSVVLDKEKNKRRHDKLDHPLYYYTKEKSETKKENKKKNDQKWLPRSLCRMRLYRLLPCLCCPFWQLARLNAAGMAVSKCSGYFRSRNNFIIGSSICKYNLLRPTSRSNFDCSTQSTYSVTALSWNWNASDRIIDVSLILATLRCFEWMIEFDATSNVIRICLRSKKNENLCFSVGKSIINNASTAIWNLRRGLMRQHSARCVWSEKDK